MDEHTCWFANHMTRTEQELDAYLGSAAADERMQDQTQGDEEDVTHI